MATPQISKKFSFSPTPATLHINVEKHIETLKEYGFDAGKILDIYIESQQLRNNIKNLTNPMRYLSSYLDEAKGNSDIRFRELERIYNNVVRDWSKITPASFMQQYITYINQGVNDTGIDNGFIREHFLDFSMNEEKLLIINPHPVVMEECLKSDKDISFTFTDDRYYQVYLTSDTAKKLERLHNLPPERYHRVLCFCNGSTQDEIIDLFDILSPALVKQKKTNIYIAMPTKYVEKRHSQPVLWDYLIQHYTIFKICLIDPKAVNTNPKKRCLMILQNARSTNDTVLIQKSKLINANTFATYNNDFVQLMMCVKLERWVVTLLPACPNMGMHYTNLDSSESLKITSKITNRLNELYLELDIEETVEDEEILLSLAAKYGGAVTIEFLEEGI